MAKSKTPSLKLNGHPTAPSQPVLTTRPQAFETLSDLPETHAGSVVTPYRIWYNNLSRYNPIRGLTPEKLSQQMDLFDQGYLRAFAQTMEKIANRDDTLSAVIPKRKATLARRRWEVIAAPNADPSVAEKHKEALVNFYNSITVTNATDLNVQRGFSMLVEQMLDAVAKKYAVHEILWRPDSEQLSATFNFVPLWFFENRSGRLRFLQNDFDLIGADLEPKNWMVTVGRHLMESCSVAYMFKNLPLKDWLLYCEKHGAPGIHGKTNHVQGSPGWNHMVDAVAAIAKDFSCVTNKDDEIEKLDFSADGTLPFQPLCERMDRAMMTIWRGGDLSTMSKDGDAVGSNSQDTEAEALELEDAMLVSETLNTQVDARVIEWTFGEGVKPQAFVKVVVPPKFDAQKEMLLDDHLAKYGIAMGKNATLERYGRAEPDESDEPLELPPSPEELAQQAAGDEGDQGEDFSANERDFERRFLANAVRALARSTAETLRPLRERIQSVLEMTNETLQGAAIASLKNDLAATLKQMNEKPENAKTVEAIMSASLLNGLAAGTKARTR